MSLRTAVRQSKILTFVVLGAFVWLLLGLLSVLRDISWLAVAGTDFVGHNAVGGIVGAVVLAIVLGVLVTLYGEVSESEPAPNTWPPSE